MFATGRWASATRWRRQRARNQRRAWWRRRRCEQQPCGARRRDAAAAPRDGRAARRSFYADRLTPSAAVDLDERILSAYVAREHESAEFVAEYARIRHDPHGASRLTAATTHAYYGQLAHRCPDGRRRSSPTCATSVTACRPPTRCSRRCSSTTRAPRAVCASRWPRSRRSSSSTAASGLPVPAACGPSRRSSPSPFRASGARPHRAGGRRGAGGARASGDAGGDGGARRRAP
jgi:hypothetical protein